MSRADPQPWEQQAGEPPQWFARFNVFRLMGPRRSLQAVWDGERPLAGKRGKAKEPSSHWNRISQEWEWRERAAAWDVHVANEDAARQAEERRALARDAFALLKEKLETLRKQRVTPAVYMQMLQIVFRELRIEYGQQPATKLELSGQVTHEIEQRLPTALKQLNLDELRALEALSAKLLGDATESEAGLDEA